MRPRAETRCAFAMQTLRSDSRRKHVHERFARYAPGGALVAARGRTTGHRRRLGPHARRNPAMHVVAGHAAVDSPSGTPAPPELQSCAPVGCGAHRGPGARVGRNRCPAWRRERRKAAYRATRPSHAGRICSNGVRAASGGNAVSYALWAPVAPDAGNPSREAKDAVPRAAAHRRTDLQRSSQDQQPPSPHPSPRGRGRNSYRGSGSGFPSAVSGGRTPSQPATVGAMSATSTRASTRPGLIHPGP